jgi:hypothetical protein
MKINQEALYHHFEKHSLYIPATIAIAITPLIIIDIRTDNYAVEIFVKLLSLFLILLSLGYNLFFRSLRKRFGSK